VFDGAMIVMMLTGSYGNKCVGFCASVIACMFAVYSKQLYNIAHK